MPYSIRLAVPSEHLFLTNLWRRSVEATHHFLSSDDIDELYVVVGALYLPGVELWVAAKGDVVQGFMGLGGHADYNARAFRKVEMLFVDSDALGTGVGSALLNFAAHRYGPLCVDVNEQNTAARGFYESKGFVARSRSALDEQGRPFPLVHMYSQG